jgi:hypothetical protein
MLLEGVWWRLQGLGRGRSSDSAGCGVAFWEKVLMVKPAMDVGIVV